MPVIPLTPSSSYPSPVSPLSAQAENNVPVGNSHNVAVNLRSLANVSEIRGVPDPIINKKNGPYYSAKRDENIDLNCKVDSSDSNNERIVCRHLGSYWRELFTQGGGKVDYRQLATLEAIRSNVSAEKYHKAHLAPGVVSLVENQYWGRVILELFRDMQNNGDTLQTIEIDTADHVMALGLKIKPASGGHKWVIQFYDPNHTATHKRAEYAANNQKDIEKLTAGNFLAKEDLSEGGVSAFIERHPLRSISTIKHLPDNLLQPMVIHHAMKRNLTDILQRVAEKLKVSSLGAGEMEKLLAAKNEDGIPGLYMALQDGYADTIRVYSEIVQQAKLRSELRMELLSAKNEDGTPGFYIALHDGYAEAVKEYGDIVLQAGLEPKLTMELLASKDENGTPGLSYALNNGNTVAVQAFGEIVLQAKLDPERVRELLASKDEDGTPGLYCALQEGHAGVVRAYVEIVLRAGLSSEYVMELLASKDKNGTPGLYWALHNGHTKTVQFFVELLLEAKLEPKNTAALLDARDRNGTQGLETALVNGHDNTAQVLLALVREYCNLLQR